MNVSTKQEIKRITYIQWNNIIQSAKATAPTPGRYFQVDQSNTSTAAAATAESTETPEFLERKTTLLSRIFRSKVENEDEDKKSIKPVAKVESELKFFDDFIPFNTSPKQEPAPKTVEKPTSYEPQLHLANYTGPYPEKSLLKARKSLVESFQTVTKSTVYTDRQLEILKIKLHIPSKFDNDKRLLNRLSNRKSEHLLRVNQKLRLAGKLSSKRLDKPPPPNQHIYLKDDEESDNASFVSEYSSETTTVVEKEDKFSFNKSTNVFFNLSSKEEEEEAKGSTTTSTIVLSSDDDMDSKCKQFDKYKEPKRTTSSVRELQEEIAELEEKYRETRDERNRVRKNVKKNKKKKNDVGESKVDAIVKSEQLMNEMKNIRKSLKVLRKNSRIESRRNYKQRKKRNNF